VTTTKTRRSRTVTTGAVLAALVLTLTACTDDEGDEQNADYSEVCVDEQGQRVDDDRCDDNDGHHTWMWFPYGYAVPAHGARVDTSKGVTVRPASGTIARPPITGGFGTYRGTTAGG